MKKTLFMMFSISINIVFSLFALHAHGEVASCQTIDQGAIASCIEFASSKSIPALMEKICTLEGSRSTKWVKNSCTRAGILGYCEVPRNDKITQVVYCYKRQGIPDRQMLEFCRQGCKGRFAANY